MDGDRWVGYPVLDRDNCTREETDNEIPSGCCWYCWYYSQSPILKDFGTTNSKIA